MLAYVNEEWAGRGVGRAMSAYVTGTVIGGFLGRFISGVIATHWNWRATFLVLAALNLIGALVVRAWLPLAKNFVRAEHLQQVLDHAREHLRNPRLLANFGMGATALFALVGCFTYTNFYLAAAPFHLNSAQLGSIFFVYLLGVVITPQAGRFLDHFGFRHTTVLYCAMMIAGLLFTLVKSLPIIIVGLAIFSSGVFVAQAAATVEMGAIAGRARSSAAGLYVAVYYLGGSVGATLTGLFWRWKGWPGCVAVLGGVSLLSCGWHASAAVPASNSTPRKSNWSATRPTNSGASPSISANLRRWTVCNVEVIRVVGKATEEGGQVPCDRRWSSAGAKCPPRGKTVQRWMLYKRSKYERGSSPSGTVWCAKTPNAVGVLTWVGSTGCQRLSQ